MSREPEVASIVAELVGVWNGLGEGEYPTIAPFSYRETTRVRERSDHPALHFDQRTWKTDADGELVSHWETGLLRISSDGTAAFNNAQPGRVETMTGIWGENGPGWTIELRSTGYAGDIRVVTAARTLWLTPGELTYEMHMETVSTGELSLHLRAKLVRDIN